MVQPVHFLLCKCKNLNFISGICLLGQALQLDRPMRLRTIDCGSPPPQIIHIHEHMEQFDFLVSACLQPVLGPL